jgi:hypothetical protein
VLNREQAIVRTGYHLKEWQFTVLKQFTVLEISTSVVEWVLGRILL